MTEKKRNPHAKRVADVDRHVAALRQLLEATDTPEERAWLVSFIRPLVEPVT